MLPVTFTDHTYASSELHGLMHGSAPAVNFDLGLGLLQLNYV